jgi:ankyrin repeat protein
MEAVVILLRHGADAEARNKTGSTALLSALHANQMEAVFVLMASGTQPFDRDFEGTKTRTFFLRRAVSINELGLLQNLLALGVDQNTAWKFGSTPLHDAVRPERSGRVRQIDKRILRILLAAGATPTNATVESGETPLHILAKSGKSEELDILAARADTLDMHTTPEYKDGPATPLYLAALYGRDDAVRVLLERGASVDEVSPPGQEYPNALWAAFMNGHYVSASHLLQNGADPDTPAGSHLPNIPGGFRDPEVSILHVEAWKGSPVGMKLLIKHKATINFELPSSGTPFHVAARYGHISSVQLLLENGVAIDSTSNNQVTALLNAADCGRLSVVHFLCQNGADWRKRMGTGQSAFVAAIRGEHLDVAAYLLALGADVNEEMPGGYLPLHYAAMYGKIAAVKWLLALGANVSHLATGVRGSSKPTGTAEDIARKCGHDQVVMILAADAQGLVDRVDKRNS